MNKKKQKYRIGDIVNIEGWTSFTTDTQRKITDIKIRYDELTGKPKKVIDCNGWEFDLTTGNAITSPIMYSIEI